jgi:two-component system, NtrC family, sensor histidine kinase KinB
MKPSIRTKFSLGIVFFFVIILLLSILSGYYLNRLSKKTSAILKENVISVICAREMTAALTNLNQEMTSCYITHKIPDSLFINKELKLFDKSLRIERNNITEIGEDHLASSIDEAYMIFHDSVKKWMISPYPDFQFLNLQQKLNELYPRIGQLSILNEKAIEIKTDDAKVSAKKALIQMSLAGSLCFLIAFSFTFSFASYFNERFFQLYNGIKEIVSSNYGQRLYFEGMDEFYDISLVFNEMAEKLSETNQKKPYTLQVELEKDDRFYDLQELKLILSNMKSIEKQAIELISKLENKK